MIGIWLRGLVLRRGARLAAAAGGIAIAVALLAALGAFLAAAKGSMTARAAHSVTVDWQVQVRPGANPSMVLGTVRAVPGVTRAVPVEYGQTSGLVATTEGSTQTTGPGVVLGVPPAYRSRFPGVLRTLTGSGEGVLLAQQTAANLHAKPGDVVQVGRVGLGPVPLRVAGVVELPQADSLFQQVGAPAGAQPSAPPDNVLLLPAASWHAVFDPLGSSHAELLGNQIHVSLARHLPADPAAAFVVVAQAAHHLEAASAGDAAVGDNLGAALDAARDDAAYAQVLFLFLGLPGAVLAGLLTAAVTAQGAARRGREQALARARGASGGQLLGLAAVEAAVIGVAGALVGLGCAALLGRIVFGTASFGATSTQAMGWAATAGLVGLVIAAATVLAPAYRDQRLRTVAAGRLAVGRVEGRRTTPWWARAGVDLLLLAGAALVFWLTSRTGYQLVLAPEGVPSISVSYWAFAGPALLWLGGGLLAWRLSDLVLGRGRRLVGWGLRPVAGRLSSVVAATISRQRRSMAGAIVLLALAVTFAVSTASFNATYRQQAEVDAVLTNGADVTVTEAPGASVGPGAARRIAAVPGVRAVEPLQHRFAYIGSDLQDFYGVRPATVTDVTRLQDAYFQGGTARQLIGTLAAEPDAILVSAETVRDFQLQPGDPLKLRLQDGHTRQFTTVVFRYAGVVKEFPTAPKDSFFVANADYVARQTGTDAVGAFLVDTAGGNTATVAGRLRDLLGTSAAVTDITATRATVGSSLTAVDLTGLTGIELIFALLLAAAAGGLVLALGFTERRRGFAIVTALGAKRRQLRGFVLGETLVLTVGGLVAGAAGGWLLSEMLVMVLTGVFDPPPAALAVPWTYLGTVGAVIVLALGGATAGAVRLLGRPAISVLREQ